MIDTHHYLFLLSILLVHYYLLVMNSLTDDAFPLFTTDNFAVFPSGFSIALPSLLARVVSTDEFEEQAAKMFENSGSFKRKRDRESKRDYKERRTRNRGYAIDEMKELTEKEFKKMFRFNRSGFYYLLSKIRKHIEAKPGIISYDLYNEILKPITPEVKLAITLRWLAGGSYLDICFAFGIAVGTFFRDK